MSCPIMYIEQNEQPPRQDLYSYSFFIEVKNWYWLESLHNFNLNEL